MIPAILKNLDKTQPLTDAQYEEVKKLNDTEKATVIQGFKSEGWSQTDIERHYLAAHFPTVKYYSSGGGGTGTSTPPKAK